MDGCDDLLAYVRTPVRTRILCLTKIGREEHMNALRAGHIYCRSLSYYKTIEGPPLPFQDAHEGLRGIYQAAKVEVRLQPKGRPPVVLNAETGLTGQVIVSADIANPVFCVHAIHTGEWTDRRFGEEELDAFSSYLQVPESMNKFGTHVWVITNGDEFVKRLRDAAARQNVRVFGSLVKYVDPSRVHGGIPREMAPFVKRDAFKDEREYRFVFSSTRQLPDPFVLDVGQLADISVVANIEELRRDWRIGFADVEDESGS